MGFLSPKMPALPPVQPLPEPPKAELSEAEKAKVKEEVELVIIGKIYYIVLNQNEDFVFNLSSINALNAILDKLEMS